MCDTGVVVLSLTDPSDTTVGIEFLSRSRIRLNEYLLVLSVRYCAKIELSNALWLIRTSRNSTVRPQHRVNALPSVAILALDNVLPEA